MDSEFFIQPKIKKQSISTLFIKRTIDITLGSLFLIVSFPIFLFAALAIRIETKGSPFFLQERVGENGRRFKIIKLRGMYVNAKERFPELYEYTDFILQEDLNFHFHFPEDPRVTRVGKFCRRTSVDELPNFINVVMGDMSMVGPRPEIPEVFDGYYGYKEGYTSVKPGITSLSKCTGRDSLTKRETLELDINYIYDQTVISDLQIIWKTMVAVIIRKHVH